jgi:delta-aminolevulinic acid dehydratase/porphobilinogen synthase
MSTFPTMRLRRTRQNEKLRGLVRETHLNVGQLIYPLFIAEGIAEPIQPNLPLVSTAPSVKLLVLLPSLVTVAPIRWTLPTPVKPCAKSIWISPKGLIL